MKSVQIISLFCTHKFQVSHNFKVSTKPVSVNSFFHTYEFQVSHDFGVLVEMVIDLAVYNLYPH